MEFWDIYDKNRIPTGKIHARGEQLGSGEYHLAVHACVFDGNGNMLIQQRQPFKSGWSNMWDVTVGGSAQAGETSQMAVHRELLEEVGLDYDFSQMRPQVTINFDGGFNDVYLVTAKNLDISTLILQADEVQAVAWANKQQVLQMIDQGKFIPYYKSWIEFLFDTHGNYGTHSLRE